MTMAAIGRQTPTPSPRPAPPRPAPPRLQKMTSKSFSIWREGWGQISTSSAPRPLIARPSPALHPPWMPHSRAHQGA